MEAKATLMRRENELRDEQMAADVALENQRKGFVSTSTRARVITTCSPAR